MTVRASRAKAASSDGQKFDKHVKDVLTTCASDRAATLRAVPAPITAYFSFLARQALVLHQTQVNRCRHPIRTARLTRKQMTKRMKANKTGGAPKFTRPVTANVEDVCLWQNNGRCALVVVERKLKATHKHTHTASPVNFESEISAYKKQARMEIEAFVNEKVVTACPGITWTHDITRQILAASHAIVYITYTDKRPLSAIHNMPYTHVVCESYGTHVSRVLNAPYAAAADVVVQPPESGTLDVNCKAGQALIAVATKCPIAL